MLQKLFSGSVWLASASQETLKAQQFIRIRGKSLATGSNEEMGLGMRLSSITHSQSGSKVITAFQPRHKLH